MKRFVLLILFLIITSISTISAQKEDLFINALKNCTPYNASEDLTVNGITATSTKQMQGWQDNKCTYKETVSFGDNNVTTVCRFSKTQIQEIVSVANTIQNTDVDNYSLETIKNNPFAQVMTKYLQDPSVCTMEGL